MTYEDWRARMTGNAFDDADVARAYAHRPPYAPELYEFLLNLADNRATLVDLGCGPGKIAAALALHFDSVLALDASGPMIDEARRLHPHPNIRFLHAGAEDAQLPEHIDLVTAGTSIHWMKHDILFPRLAARTPLIAVIAGDAPPAPPWAREEQAFLAKWLSRIGLTYNPAFAQEGRDFEAWMDIAGRRQFAFAFQQRIDDYIECQHSRATFSRARMGDDVAREYDDELRALLRPFATDNVLTYDLVSDLTWGAPRTALKLLECIPQNHRRSAWAGDQRSHGRTIPTYRRRWCHPVLLRLPNATKRSKAFQIVSMRHFVARFYCILT